MPGEGVKETRLVFATTEPSVRMQTLCIITTCTGNGIIALTLASCYGVHNYSNVDAAILTFLLRCVIIS